MCASDARLWITGTKIMQNSNADSTDPNESLAVAINYARERYVEELARFDHLEEKSGKFLGTLTIAIGVFSVLAGSYLEAAGRPSDSSDWVTLIALVVTFAAMASAWGHVLAVLRLKTVDVAAKRPEAIAYIRNNQAVARDEYILRCYSETTQRIAKDLEEKERDLKIAYDDIVFSGGAFLASVVLVVLNKWWLS